MLTDILYELLNNITGAKNLEDLPELPMSEKERKEIEDFVHEVYIEYQAFMEISNLPDYNLFVKPQHGLELGSVKYVKNEGYNLYISDTLLKRQNTKEILFHEFTHIYDKEHLDKTYAYRKGNDVDNRKTHIFTEIHAEQIRFLYTLGCKIITDKPNNISHNSLVFNLDGKQNTFYNYLNEYRLKLVKSFFIEAQEVKKKTKTIERTSIECMIDKIAYYIGALTIYQKYCQYNLNEIMDLSSISNFWNIDLEKLIVFYCSHDIHKPTMETVKKIDIADMGDILMHNLIVEARKIFTISGDIICR